jgi:hypothetical protein
MIMFKRHFLNGRKTSKGFTLPLLVLCLFSFAFLNGCTSSDVITVPFTESQFYSRTTDLNYVLFTQGVYDGNFLLFDGNKLSVGAIDISSEDIDWSQLINFPSGCSDNQAVKIVGSSLICVDLPTDLNYVPYTGATDDVDLGSSDLFTTGSINIDSVELSDNFGTLEVDGGLYILGSWLDAYNAYFENNVEIAGGLYLNNLTDNGFLKTSGGNGTVIVDTSTYLTSVAYADLTGSPSDVINAGTNLSWSGDTLNAVDTNFENAGFDFGDYVPYIGADQDLNLGVYNVDTNYVYANVVWADQNRGYGTMYCVDGNIVMGYLVGFSC